MRKLIIALGVLGFMSGCASTGPITATSNPVGSKKGTACSKRVFGVPLSLDRSIYKAARNGGVSKISTVDSHSFGIPVLFDTVCTTVRGQ